MSRRRNNQKYSLQSSLSTTSIFQSPLPSAEQLAMYEDTLPGTANRILAMAEQQMKHRHETETKMTNANIKLNYLGLLANIIIGVSPLVLSAVLAIYGFGLAAGLVAGGGVISFGGSAIYAMIKYKNSN